MHFEQSVALAGSKSWCDNEDMAVTPIVHPGFLLNRRREKVCGLLKAAPNRSTAMPASTTGKQRRLSRSMAVLGVVGLVAAFASATSAQTKKAESKRVESLVKQAKIADIPSEAVGGLAQVASINEMLDKAWKDNKIIPAERCTDYEFIRRASLDIIGRIAKVEEIGEFMKDPPERRRSRLIERLLKSPDYASNWANIWTVLLITRTGAPKLYQDQMRDWLADKLTDSELNAADWSKIATLLLVAQGETHDNGAVNFVLAHLGEEIKRDNAASGRYDMVPVTSRTTRLFLGLRTQCVQCHDHPFQGEWLQQHFWGINAFFRQVETNGRPTKMANKKKEPGTQRFAVKDNPQLNAQGIVPYERRSGVLLFTDAAFLDGRKMPALKDSGTSTRRAELAKFITTSPYFAKAFVNRTWGHLFGRGFTKDAVDDFGEHNPIAHPELFEKLSSDWAKSYHHNPKVLIRWICNSKAYGLASTANTTNDKADDEAYFARMLLKVMSPEQLFDSLMTATEAKVGQAKTTKDELRKAWLDKLIVNFGDDEGNEGSFNGTVVQALMLMNGSDINNAITDKDTGTAALVMKKFPPSNTVMAAKAMDVLFKAALNRPPTAKEITKILDPKTFSFRPGAPAPRDPVAFWTAYYQDVFWALLNSNEFILNH
jgi:hypothetical protein